MLSTGLIRDITNESKNRKSSESPLQYAIHNILNIIAYKIYKEALSGNSCYRHELLQYKTLEETQIVYGELKKELNSYGYECSFQKRINERSTEEHQTDGNIWFFGTPYIKIEW
jgi:hypothetical protein